MPMIDVIVDDEVADALSDETGDLPIPPLADIRAAVQATCQAVGFPAEAPELCIRFASDAEVKALNGQWRNRDKVTDVLSFPMQEGPSFDAGEPLGDIVLAMPYVLHEAERLELKPASHILHLIVHATLHLLGHVHDDDAEAEAMQRLERNVMHTLGLHDPYPDPEHP